jgi:hypothetical protein
LKRRLAFLLVAFVSCVARGAAADEPARGDGPYGNLSLTGSLAPFGSGNELERGCVDLGAVDCSTPIPLGFGFLGHVGLARGRVGYEIFLAALGDLHRPSARYDGVPHRPNGNPLLSIPPREETFILLRAGFMLVPRIRYTIENETTRFSFAGGIGLAYRIIALEREVMGEGGVEDRPYFAKAVGYLSPALSLGAQFQVRSTATLAIVFGLGLSFDNAGSDTRSKEDPNRTVAGNGQSFPIATPPYAVSSGIQFLLLPYVGLAFGP